MPRPLDAPARTRHGRTLLWCGVGTALGALYVGAAVLLQRMLPDAGLPGRLVHYTPPAVFLLPLAVPALACLTCRRFGLLAANVALILLGVAWLMPPSSPELRPPTASAARVRLVTWNVHEEVGATAPLSAALARQQPQIVCLQEARRDVFARLLPGAESAHTDEVTTLTTGHIEAKRAVRLGPHPNIRWGLETTIRLPQGAVTVLNVHLVRTFAERRVPWYWYGLGCFTGQVEQVRRLEAEAVVAWLAQTPGPCIVAGDFNTPPQTAVYRKLAAAATDAFAVCGAGWGYTYPRGCPVVRLDYVFCGSGVTPTAVHAVSGGVSDHRLVVADVALE